MRRLVAPALVLLVLGGGFLLALPEAPRPPTRLETLRERLAPLRGRGDDPAAVGMAASALQDAFARDPLTSSELREAWQSDDAIVRWAGWLSVESYGAPDDALWAALATALADAETPDVRAAAARAAVPLSAVMPGRLRDVFLRAARDPASAVRGPAFGVLVALAPADRRVWTLLGAALSDPSADCRERAANALAKIPFSDLELASEDARELVQRLRGALSDAQESTRMYAAMTLGRIGPAAAAAIPDLVALLRGDEALLQGHAATALGRIGAPALRALTLAVHDVPPRQIPMVLWAIRLVGEPAKATLRDVMRAHEVPAARVVAAMKLWEMESSIDGLLPAFEEALSRADVEAQLQAARGLERIGPAASAVAPHLRRARERAGATATDPGTLRRALDAAIESVTR